MFGGFVVFFSLSLYHSLTLSFSSSLPLSSLYRPAFLLADSQNFLIPSPPIFHHAPPFSPLLLSPSFHSLLLFHSSVPLTFPPLFLSFPPACFPFSSFAPFSLPHPLSHISAHISAPSFGRCSSSALKFLSIRLFFSLSLMFSIF